MKRLETDPGGKIAEGKGSKPERGEFGRTGRVRGPVTSSLKLCILLNGGEPIAIDRPLDLEKWEYLSLDTEVTGVGGGGNVSGTRSTR